MNPNIWSTDVDPEQCCFEPEYSIYDKDSTAMVVELWESYHSITHFTEALHLTELQMTS